MAKEQNLFPLKMLVISLGVLLLGGVAFLCAALLDRKGGCEPATLALAEGEAVQDVKVEGRSASITLKDKENNYIVRTVDLCTGKEKASLTITPR